MATIGTTGTIFIVICIRWKSKQYHLCIVAPILCAKTMHARQNINVFCVSHRFAFCGVCHVIACVENVTHSWFRSIHFDGKYMLTVCQLYRSINLAQKNTYIHIYGKDHIWLIYQYKFAKTPNYILIHVDSVFHVEKKRKRNIQNRAPLSLNAKIVYLHKFDLSFCQNHAESHSAHKHTHILSLSHSPRLPLTQHTHKSHTDTHNKWKEEPSLNR